MPGFSHVRTRNDDMHCTKLGVGLYAIGNSLVYLASMHIHRILGPAVEYELPHDAPIECRLDDLTFRCKQYLKDHHITCSFRRFTLARIGRKTNADAPLYSAKASHTAPLIAWLAELTLTWAERCPLECKLEAYTVANCIWGLGQYLHTCRNGGRFLTTEEADIVNHAGHVFLYMYGDLRRASIEKGTCMWQLVPKHHQFQHIVLDIQADRCN